ncbi:MAG: hypothetical protein QF377_01585 [Candidatus Thalassarchaeum sp.]|jgi:hypothetical protein|nr:hypothetical protein [Candidatus Thalassarchaeum sp.]MDP7003671.1 hypothetical protein [Candidatus Thalassarchaeaceae archaeon]
MLWPVGPYETMMVVILSLTIPLQRLLTRDEPEMRLPLRGLPDEIRAKGYQWHISMYVLMYLFKAFIDQHNEAIKPRVGGFTHLVYDLEGGVTQWVQESFENGALTDLLSFHYLFIYLFLIWFSPMYYILCRDEVMADKAVLNYVVIYVLAVPFYLFFNVEVTSTFIPGMDALMYHNEWNLFFFTEVDPLDNGVPSLHVGIPISLLIINRLHVRELGISIGEWRHREFDLFVAANVPIYLFSIQYLGIHWLFDLVPGLLLAVVCAIFSHRIQPILRAVPEKGWGSLAPDRFVATAAAAFTLVGVAILAVAVIDGPGTDSDKPTMRLGPGDVNLDVIEIHSLWDPVVVEVSNVGNEAVEVLVIHRDNVREHAKDGAIDWSAPLAGEAFSLGAGESWQGEVETPSVFDGHYVLVSHQGDSGIGEVRVTIDYVDDALIWSALLCSVPSFSIMGWVLGGIRRVPQEIIGEESA